MIIVLAQQVISCLPASQRGVRIKGFCVEHLASTLFVYLHVLAFSTGLIVSA